MVRHSDSGLGGLQFNPQKWRIFPLTGLSPRVLKYLGRSLHDNSLVFLGVPHHEGDERVLCCVTSLCSMTSLELEVPGHH